MKKLAIALVILIVLGVIGVGGGYLVIKSGFGGADDWVVRRVVRIAETYIEPKIEFDDFAWDGSRTITLDGVTLTSQDGTEVVTAGSMVIVTERVPVNGGAFIIEAITLKDSTLRLVQTTDPDGTIGFKGLVPFVKKANIENQEKLDKDVKLSETFQIRSIKLENGGLEYDLGDGSQPMILTEITLDVNLTPEDNGAYAIDVDLSRDKIFDMVIRGELNLDTLALNKTHLTFNADLSSDEAKSAVPPQIQKLLREYEVRGQLVSTISGDLLLSDPAASTMNVDVRLTDGHLAIGEYGFPLAGLRLKANLAGKQLDVPAFDVSAVGGLFSFTTFTADLSAEGMPFNAAWTGSDLDIQQFLRYQPEEGKKPKFAGILATKGNVRIELADLAAAMEGTLDSERLTGSGTLTLRKGRLVSIPIISDVVDAMDIVAAVTGTQTMKDKADIEFNIDGKGLEFPNKKSLDISTQVASLYGTGRINFDQTLRLSLNGGPMEKIHGQLGGVGDIIGMVTDGFVKYVVKGTMSDPKVSIKPLGIGG